MNSRQKPVVAIDGPAGAGKSTVTRRVAAELGYQRVDTGALYRAVAWLCDERGIDWNQARQVAASAAELARPGALTLGTSGEDISISAFGQDITQAIRSRRASAGASHVSQLPEVRQALLSLQRELGKGGGVVLEGRDIGSVVFPDAEAKFFLTARTSVRGERRRAELLELGDAPPLPIVIAEVEERDRRDTERAIAPLVRAPDAEVVDSSDIGIDEVVRRMVERVRELERAMG